MAIWFFRFVGLITVIVSVAMLILSGIEFGIPTNDSELVAAIATNVLFFFLGSCGAWLMFNANQV
jgi:hypothetical protein